MTMSSRSHSPRPNQPGQHASGHNRCSVKYWWTLISRGICACLHLNCTLRSQRADQGQLCIQQQSFRLLLTKVAKLVITAARQQMISFSFNYMSVLYKILHLELFLQALKGALALDQALSCLFCSSACLSSSLVSPLPQNDALQPAHLLLGVAAAQLLMNCHGKRRLVGESLQYTPTLGDTQTHIPSCVFNPRNAWGLQPGMFIC